MIDAKVKKVTVLQDKVLLEIIVDNDSLISNNWLDYTAKSTIEREVIKQLVEGADRNLNSGLVISFLYTPDRIH